MTSPLLPFVPSLRDTDFRSGALLLIDKPKDWTSFDVVNKVRGLLRKKYGIKNIKVGHSGTLDPMATGLLLLCTGAWTKELHSLQGLDKRYTGVVTLGVETDSYDAEGHVLATQEVPPCSLAEMDALLQDFKGVTDQYPPIFSAIKKDGKPLYALARAGKEVITEPRKVTVFDIHATGFETPHLVMEVHCGSGFYVRSLAHDIGVKLNCGAHLSALCRTSIGPYRLEHAFTIEDIVAGVQ